LYSKVVEKVRQIDLYIFNLLAFLKGLKVKAVVEHVIRKLNIKGKLKVEDSL
jgi:hypothetical protein